MNVRIAGMTAAFAVALAFASQTNAQGKKVGPDPQELQKVLAKAVSFLETRQNKDGSFSPRLAGPGISALVASSLLRAGVSRNESVVARTMKYLESQVQKDGGVYNKFLANYTTCVAVMAFKEANAKGRYDALLANAAKFLKSLQQEADGKEDVEFGGFGYGKKGRPDLSNSNYAVAALLAAGIPKDDPAIKNALIFLSRCQNLAGEDNDQPFAKKASKDDKGGFTYNPLEDKKSPYRTANGGLRSLGGMTYGALKSLLYAGVSKDDKRIKAAIDWIRRHYTLDMNPGKGKSGLFYYYHTFAKAMDAWGEDQFKDAKGVAHDWRMELFTKLRDMQMPNGGWRNMDKSFGESNEDLATAFAVLSLSYCKR